MFTISLSVFYSRRFKMTAMTVFISSYLWRRISRELRRAILRVLSRKEIVGEFVANVCNDLRVRGEYELAAQLIAEVEYLRDYKREWGVLPPVSR